MSEIKTEIVESGQPYVDEPVYSPGKPNYETVKRTEIASAVAHAYGSPTANVKILKPNQYRRTRLRWWASQGNGVLLPK